MENNTKDCYKSISALSKGVYRDKGSKFLSFAYPVESEAEVKIILSGVKKEYFDARHHCYAYRIGYLGDIWRCNDDGEPSSSAGRPILGQILSNELSDILIIVVRYFGGIKLGVPGLIKAYKSASSDAITNAEIVEKIATVPFNIRFSYEKMNDVMKGLKEMNILPSDQSFDLTCSINLRVRMRDIERFKETMEQLADLTEITNN